MPHTKGKTMTQTTKETIITEGAIWGMLGFAVFAFISGLFAIAGAPWATKLWM